MFEDMSSFLSFANTLVKKVFTVEPDSVVEVKVEDYIHYDILAREDSLILHSFTKENSQLNYEIVLHRENQSKLAFSIYRSKNVEETQVYYLTVKDKLPEFVRLFPALANVSTLQDVCRYIRTHPSQNLASICAHFGHVDYFKQLQKSPSSSATDLANLIDHQDDGGKTPLMVAIEMARFLVIQTILTLKPKLDRVDKEGNNLLHYAAQTTPEIIGAICGAIISNNESSLMEASTPSAEQPIMLVELINSRNNSNFSPLYLACSRDKPECVKELLKNGADVNGASIGEHHRAQSPSETESFMGSGSGENAKLFNKLNMKDMKNGGTPLHWCKSAEVVEMLIDKNCNLDARNFHGDTALHIMVARSDLACVLSLLSHGADVDAIGANGNTPLHLAIKAADVNVVKSIIVFGADVNIHNSIGESPRHLAATSPRSINIDTILYVLHTVRANRCMTARTNCNEGCSPGHSYNGVPPENSAFIRETRLYDQILIESIVKAALQAHQRGERANMVKVLSLDGGGIRGMILIQIIAYLEKLLNKRIADTFDWIGGTSTGAILALLLASGYSANKCLQIYFRLKDKIFVGYRPYCSETLETFLQTYLGKDKCMRDIAKPKVMITATVANKFPPDAKFFRNYPGPNDVLDHAYKYDPLPELRTSDELLWKVARASGAAPTYFSQFEHFLDGGLISNNPTLDLLTEIQNLNRAAELSKRPADATPIGLIVSVGTGAIPKRAQDKLNFSSIASISGFSSFATSLPSLLKVLIEQASQADGQVVERAQAWCSMINVPYFRMNPPISEEIPMDESDNAKLVNMLWETMVYLHIQSDSLAKLITLLQ